MLNNDAMDSPGASQPRLGAKGITSRLGLLDVSQMCERLGVSRELLRRIMDDPLEQFPYFFIGRRRFARPEDVQAWVENKWKQVA